MGNPSIKEAILKQVEHLAPDLQRRVLDFARSLALSPPRGTTGKQLLHFAGILTDEEARAMTEAIEEGCERIDGNEW